MYRSPPSLGPSCDTHPAAEARARCSSCDAKICTPCSLYVDLRIVCPRCAKRSWRSGAVRKYGTRAAIAAAFIGAIGGLALQIGGRRADPFNWGSHASAIRKLRTRVDGHPCDAPALLAITDEYEQAYDPWSAIQTLRMATAVCPLDESVHQRELTLLMGQHQWRDAIRTATRLIAMQPEVADHYFARAYAEQMDAEPSLAADDYIETLRRDPSKRQAIDALEWLYAGIGDHDSVARIKQWARAQKNVLEAMPVPDLPRFGERPALF
jgi:tetratricopeptide (TPR) repeat protein